MQLGERRLKVLSLIVEAYIATGEPVGSKKLCQSLENSVSSATIRNDMTELTNLGMIEQPHTSAGRIPTQRAYRMYVDELMQHRELFDNEKMFIDSILEERLSEPDRFLDGAATLLSQITGLTAITTTPSNLNSKIRLIELVPIGRRTLLMLMMTSATVMQKRICKLDFEITPEVLVVFKKALNEQFIGKKLSEITPAMIQSIAVGLGPLAMMISPLLLSVSETAKEASKVNLKIEAPANLLSNPDIDFQQAKELFSLFKRQNELIELINSGKGVNIYIGKESGFPELEFFSLIVGHYCMGDKGSGAIGVIGPIRLDYSKVISNIEYFSSSIGRLLINSLDEEN